MAAPQQPMLARRQLRLAVVAALQGIQSMAGIVTIDSPGDWSTPPEKMPAILIRAGRERKESIGKTIPEFNTNAVVEIEARLEEATAAAAQDAIEALGYAIENAVLKDYNIVSMVQQFTSVDTDTEISAEGRRQIGAFKMAISCEMFEAFDPEETDPLATTWPAPFSATSALTSIGLHADMVNVFDQSGTYTPSADAPPYTPTPAPRTSGPDGRDEGALDITLPQ